MPTLLGPRHNDDKIPLQPESKDRVARTVVSRMQPDAASIDVASTDKASAALDSPKAGAAAELHGVWDVPIATTDSDSRELAPLSTLGGTDPRVSRETAAAAAPSALQQNLLADLKRRIEASKNGDADGSKSADCAVDSRRAAAASRRRAEPNRAMPLRLPEIELSSDALGTHAAAGGRAAPAAPPSRDSVAKPQLQASVNQVSAMHHEMHRQQLERMAQVCGGSCVPASVSLRL